MPEDQSPSGSAGHTILLATRNAGKVREIREIAAGRPLLWRSLAELPNVPEIEESGTTFAENARLKALYYAEQTGLCTLADDSGLEVDALEAHRVSGQPASRARRRMPPPTTASSSSCWRTCRQSAARPVFAAPWPWRAAGKSCSKPRVYSRV